LLGHESYAPACILTRRPIDDVDSFSGGIRVTQSLQELIDSSDVVVECSGDPIHATEVVASVLDAGIPVVTMDAEFQVTTGSYLVGRGLLTEAHGDQPGALAELHSRALSMGFEPVVCGNRKGFLNPDPTPDAMQEWSARQGISLDQVTAATDGTKIHIEQVLVANGLGLDLPKDGLTGESCGDLEEGALKLFEKAECLGTAIADYVVCPASNDAVFVVAKHAGEEAAALEYFRLGKGPAYLLRQPHHLCHLEIPMTLDRVCAGEGVLINNSAAPKYGVAGIAKRALRPGERIERAIGSFQVRGKAVPLAGNEDHVPIGLIAGATVENPIAAGDMITREMLDLPDSLARTLWENSLS